MVPLLSVTWVRGVIPGAATRGIYRVDVDSGDLAYRDEDGYLWPVSDRHNGAPTT